MAKLGLQPADVSRQASESVKGTWSKGDIMMFLTIMKRNFSIGLTNDRVTPTLIPNVPVCPGAEMRAYPALKLDVLARHGFAMTLEIAPHEWESGKILRVAYAGEKPKKRINPAPALPDHHGLPPQRGDGPVPGVRLHHLRGRQPAARDRRRPLKHQSSQGPRLRDPPIAPLSWGS